MLAHLARTSTSLDEHGENLSAEWAPDGTKIVIQVCALRCARGVSGGLRYVSVACFILLAQYEGADWMLLCPDS